MTSSVFHGKISPAAVSLVLAYVICTLAWADEKSTEPAQTAPAQASEQAANGYVGANTCALCHVAEFEKQTASEHAMALSPASGHRLAAEFFHVPKQTRQPGFQFDFTQRSAVQISDAKTVVSEPVEWAFGYGTQAVTFVSQVNAAFYLEHFFSYYPTLGKLAATPGQLALQPAVLAEAAGLYYKTKDPDTGIDACFRCHSTGPITFDPGNAIHPHELGVRCEACHGPGKAHVAAAIRGDSTPQALIVNPGRMNAMDQLRLCGTCHRSPDQTQPVDWSYSWNVRHEPLYLAQSACFRKSRGALSCLTCHSPHGPLRDTAPSSYNAECQNCHASRPSACSTNCVNCHMPRVSPQAGLTFTNHRIGIYPSGTKLIPRP